MLKQGLFIFQALVSNCARVPGIIKTSTLLFIAVTLMAASCYSYAKMIQEGAKHEISSKRADSNPDQVTFYFKTTLPVTDLKITLDSIHYVITLATPDEQVLLGKTSLSLGPATNWQLPQSHTDQFTINASELSSQAKILLQQSMHIGDHTKNLAIVEIGQVE